MTHPPRAKEGGGAVKYGFDWAPGYVLFGEIEATARAYVGAAVTEIATLRAELSGPQVG
jgi:hypothetical protein